MKSLALENYELVEMTAIENNNTDGGNFWFGVAASATAAFLYECVNDWDNNVAAYHKGQK